MIVKMELIRYVALLIYGQLLSETFLGRMNNEKIMKLYASLFAYMYIQDIKKEHHLGSKFGFSSRQILRDRCLEKKLV